MILVLGVTYLLLRPFLVERFGWNLPGFTDVSKKPDGTDAPAGTRSARKEKAPKNRPIEVPTIPEQSEPVPDDPVIAQNDRAAESQESEGPPASQDGKRDATPEPDPAEQPPERQVATATAPSAVKPRTSGSGNKNPKPTPDPAKPKPAPAKPGPPDNSNQASSTKSTNGKPSTTAPVSKPGAPKLGVLTLIGRDTYESTAGLIYRPERSEHRIDHVMQHSTDIRSKPVHGVFDGTRDEILALIDEAYNLSRTRGPPQVIKEEQGDRQTITVNLNRKIGYMGGENGARRGHPPLKMIKLVLEDRDLITAYPTNN